MAGFPVWRESRAVMNPTLFSLRRSSLAAVSLLCLGLAGGAGAIDALLPVKTLTPPSATGSLSGNAVAMNENFILVGAPGASLTGGSNQGAVDVYHAKTRAFIRRLRGAVPLNGERFGSTVAILRNTAYIGAPGRGMTAVGAGAVYAFDIPTGKRLWIHEGTGMNEAAGGASLAVAGEYLAVGLPMAYSISNYASKAGYVRLLNPRTGAEAGIIESPTPEADDNCGAALAGYGCMLAVGVPYADEATTNSGMVMLVDMRKAGFPKTIVSYDSVQMLGVSLALQDGYLASAHHYGVVVSRLFDPMQYTTLGSNQIGSVWTVTMTGDLVIYGESSSGGGGQVFAHDMAAQMQPFVIDVPQGQQRLSFGRSLAALGGTLVAGDGSIPNSYVYDLPAITWPAAKMTTVLRTNGNAVGASGQYASIGNYVMNTSGKVAAVADLKGTGITTTNRQGVWSTLSGPTDLVVRAGDAVGALKLTGVSPAFLNSTTRGLVLGKLSGTGARIILEDNGMTLAEIVREGATINAGKSLLRLHEVVQPDSTIASGRATAAGAYKTGIAGVTAASDSAIFSTGMVATFGEVAREGNASPVSGLNYGQIMPRVARPNGNVAFCTTLTGAAATTANNVIVVRHVISTGVNKVIARKGDAAPGAFGANFSTFVGENACANGSVMFRATLAGASTTSNEGIWVTDNDGNNLQLAARKGSPAPFMPPGVTFSRFIKVHQTGYGALFIMAAVGGSGVTPANDLVIWFYERTTGFVLIAREGERAAGAGGARLGTFQNFEAEPNETFILAASLTECSTAINQGLFMGRASVGAPLRRTQPHLQVRKGSRYVRTGSQLVSSLSFPSTADKAGLTNKGRGNIVAYERAAFKLLASDGTVDLMAGTP